MISCWHFNPRTFRSYTRIATAGLFLLTVAACSESAVGPEVQVQDQIIFLSARDGATDNLDRPIKEIYRMNADGSGVERLTSQPGVYYHLSLSPDGSRMAFGLGADIWVMDTDGSNLVRLTNPSGGGEHGGNAWPRWSPDGSRIAFTTTREGRTVGVHSGMPDAYVMNADGTNPVNVSHSLGEELGFNVNIVGWSPAGRVVFETDAQGGGGVDQRAYLVNPDGTDLEPLFDRAGDYSPAWSPDGSQVAFISERDGGRRLYLMNADGSEVRPLTDHSGHDRLPGPYGFSDAHFEYSPWSPDGTRIAFERFDDEANWGTLHVINADGSGLRRLSNHSSGFNGWSPDGDRIAYTRWTLDLRDVHVINPDGSGLQNLTNGAAEDTDALWLPAR